MSFESQATKGGEALLASNYPYIAMHHTEWENVITPSLLEIGFKETGKFGRISNTEQKCEDLVDKLNHVTVSVEKKMAQPVKIKIMPQNYLRQNGDECECLLISTM